MRRYDPDETPNPKLWLALDERRRINLVETFHKTGRNKLPNLAAHAAFHAIVENQIAEGLASVVRAMARLERQGMSRHDCIHAIAWVLSQHFFDVLHANEPDSPAAVQTRYEAAVERLDAAAWRAQELS